MSGAPLTAAAAATDAPALPLCPCCGVMMRATVPDAFPHSFPCGHWACVACASATAACTPPVCCVCSAQAVSGSTPDLGFSAFVEAVFAEVGAAGGPAASSAQDCEDCKQVRPDEVDTATHICETCGGKPLCEAHVTGHTKRKVPHTVITVSAPLPTQTHCIKHTSNALTRFCIIDATVICADCMVDEHSGHDVQALAVVESTFRSDVQNIGARCGTAAVDALSAFESLTAAKARMVARKAASIAKLAADVELLKTALDDHVKEVNSALDKELKARVKAIDAQLDALSVATNQLRCAAAMCARSAASSTALELAQTVQTAKRACALIQPYRGPCVSTIVEAVSGVDAVLANIGALSRLRLQAVVSKLTTKVDTKTSATTIELGVWDDAGAAVDELSVDDVVLWCDDTVEPPSAVPPRMQPAQVEVVAQDVLRAVLPDATLGGKVRVSVSGCVARVGKASRPKSAALAARTLASPRGVVPGAPALEGGPDSVQAAVDVRAVDLRPLSVTSLEAHVRSVFAVSPDRRLVLSSDDNSLVVRDLQNGGEPQRISWYSCVDACFSPHGDAVIALDAGNCICKFAFPSGAYISAFDAPNARVLTCNNNIIVVATATSDVIRVHDYKTGKLVRSFGRFGSGPGQLKGCVAVRLSPNGRHILVAESENKRLSLFTVDGEFVRHYGVGVLSAELTDAAFGPRYAFLLLYANAVGMDGFSCVAVVRRGDIYVTDGKEHMLLLCGITGRVLQRWSQSTASDTVTRFCKPSAVAVRGSRVYVLDSTGHLFDFEVGFLPAPVCT